MRGPCGTCVVEAKCIPILLGKNLRKRDHLEKLGVDGTVIFKENLGVNYSKTHAYTQLLSMVQLLPQKYIKDITLLVDNNIYSG